MLPPEIKAQQVLIASSRLALLQEETARAKEEAILPEDLWSSRQADVKKHAEALANARKKQEEHQVLQEEVQAAGA